MPSPTLDLTKGAGMLRRVTASPQQLVMERGSSGYRTQEISASWNGQYARLSVRRAHGGEASVELDRVELEALVGWANGLLGHSGDRGSL